MIRRSASTMCLLSRAGVPSAVVPTCTSAVGIFRLVVEHAVVGDDLRREHCLQLLPRVGAVRAELVQERDVVIWPAEMLEQPGDDSVVRRRAGDVGEGDADFCVSGEMRSSNGWLPIGFLKRAEYGRLSHRPSRSMCAGSMTVVRSSGTSMGRWPEPYARLTVMRNAAAE